MQVLMYFCLIFNLLFLGANMYHEEWTWAIVSLIGAIGCAISLIGVN